MDAGEQIWNGVCVRNMRVDALSCSVTVMLCYPRFNIVVGRLAMLRPSYCYNPSPMYWSIMYHFPRVSFPSFPFHLMPVVVQ